MRSNGFSVAKALRTAVVGLLLGLGLCGAGSASSKLIYSADAFFAKNSDQLDAAAKGYLLAWVEKIDDASPEVLILVGHADKDERDAEAISLRRAKAVKFYLMQLGVAPGLIYTEPKGARQPIVSGPSDKNRRVELEFVGLVGSFAKGQGFALMNAWKLDGDPSSKNQDEWSGIGPLEFVARITDVKAKQRFVNQLALVAIHNKNDGLLKVANLLREQMPLPAPVGASPALHAQLFGSPYAQALFAGEAAQVPFDSQGRYVDAKRLWCDRTYVEHPTFDTAMKLLLPKPEALALLSVAEQHDWVSCATQFQPRARLGWLQRQGVSLDASVWEKRTSLHRAVNSGNLVGVQNLLFFGAAPSVADGSGDTPLHFAERATNGEFHLPLPVSPSIKRALWDALIAAGADPRATNVTGQVPVEPPALNRAQSK